MVNHFQVQAGVLYTEQRLSQYQRVFLAVESSAGNYNCRSKCVGKQKGIIIQYSI